MKEKSVISESIISSCQCHQNLADVVTHSFVVYDEEEGSYIRYMSIDEKCRLCGDVVNSFGDVDWDATEEDYRLYRENRVREGAVFCPYCRDLFDSESWLAKHIAFVHTDTIRKQGVQ